MEAESSTCPRRRCALYLVRGDRRSGVRDPSSTQFCHLPAHPAPSRVRTPVRRPAQHPPRPWLRRRQLAPVPAGRRHRQDRLARLGKLSLARGSEEFIVREHYAEEAPRVVVLCDRRPSMSIFANGWPWLRKPEAIREAARVIGDSAVAARGLLGYFDEGDGECALAPAARFAPARLSRPRAPVRGDPDTMPAGSLISSSNAATCPRERSSSSSPTSSSSRPATSGSARSSGGGRSSP